MAHVGVACAVKFVGSTDPSLRAGPQVPLREVPPHTGFGSEADSLQSIYHLIPKVCGRSAAHTVESKMR